MENYSATINRSEHIMICREINGEEQWFEISSDDLYKLIKFCLDIGLVVPSWQSKTITQVELNLE